MRHENNFLTAMVIALGILSSAATALAEPVRVAMPSKSLTFLNYYLADKFGLFKNEGLEVSLPVGKADVQLAAVVSGEM
jgi:ABC-type nitrate/sulfonate/bicarbonate transport system substrate-binding protein